MAASPTSVRVLVVLHEVDVGGATRAVLQPIPYLEELGWDFVFWAPTGGSVEATLRDSGRVMDGVPRLLRYRWPALREPPGPRARALAVLPYMTRYRRWLARVAQASSTPTRSCHCLRPPSRGRHAGGACSLRTRSWPRTSHGRSPA